MVGRQPRRVWKRESVKWWKITKGKQCSTVKYIIRNEKKIVLKRNQVFWYEIRRLSSRNVAHIYSRGRLKGPMLVECSQQTKPRTICCGCSNTSTIHKQKRKTKTMHSNTRRVILSFNNFLLLLFLRHQQNLLCIEFVGCFDSHFGIYRSSTNHKIQRAIAIDDACFHFRHSSSVHQILTIDNFIAITKYTSGNNFRLYTNRQVKRFTISMPVIINPVQFLFRPWSALPSFPPDNVFCAAVQLLLWFWNFSARYKSHFLFTMLWYKN